jgi:hypothetical protein
MEIVQVENIECGWLRLFNAEQLTNVSNVVVVAWHPGANTIKTLSQLNSSNV